FRAPPKGIILDDFVVSMTVARLGYRALYEPEAVAIEKGTLTSNEEFWRKVRIVAGGVQALKMRQGLPRLTQPLLVLCYVSHKLLRWLLPCLLVAVFVSSAVLVSDPFFLVLLVAQAMFYSIGAAYAFDLFGFRRRRWCGISFYFCLVNSAALLGLWK